MNIDGYISIKGILKRFSLKSESTVWKWVKNGKFPEPIRISPRVTRWRISDVVEWEESRINSQE